MPGDTINVDRRFLSGVFPGFRLVGAVRLAFDLRKLVIAALGLALLQLGWLTLDRLFPASPNVTPDTSLRAGPGGFNLNGEAWASASLRLCHERISQPFRDLLFPLLALFDPRGDWAAMLHALLAIGWLLVIWGICGGAICRIAVVQIAGMQQTGLAQAIGFSLHNAAPLILAPLIPLGCLAFLAALLAVFGLIYRLPLIGGALGGFLLVIPLALGLIMTLLTAALAASWPLVQAALAAGAEDALDALSRSFGYLNQRIGSFVALAGFAWVGGMIGIVLMDLLAAGVLRMTEWGLGLTGPATELAASFGGAGGSLSPVSAATHAFWLGGVTLVAHGWAYSFYWTSAAFVYLWLRHDVDGTPWEDLDPPGVPASAMISAGARAQPVPPSTSPQSSE